MSGCSRMPVDGDLVAVDDVEAPRRQAGGGEQLGEEHRRRRILLARLEHERVAAGQGVGEHPHRHHRREVERGDPGDDAERLADRVDVDARRRLLGVAALEQVRDAAGELDVLQAAGDLAEGVAEHLAVLGREQRRRSPCGWRRRARGSGTSPRPGVTGSSPATPGRPPEQRPRRHRPRRRWRSRPSTPALRLRGCTPRPHGRRFPPTPCRRSSARSCSSRSSHRVPRPRRPLLAARSLALARSHRCIAYWFTSGTATARA